jgi:hypothetical protein
MLNDVLWNGSRFVAVGDGGVSYASPDGVSWQKGTSATPEVLYGVAWNGASFTAVGTHAARVESEDGLAWTSVDVSTGNDLYSVRWSGGRLVALGRFGTILRDSCGADREGVSGATSRPASRKPRPVGR